MTDERKDPKSLLAEAIKKRDELNTFIKVLEEMTGMSDPAQASASKTKSPVTPTGQVLDPTTVVYPGMFFGKSQPEAVKLLLETVKRPLRTKVILDCLEKGGRKVESKRPVANLWGALNRSEPFVLVPKAGWALAEWYEPSLVEKMRKEGAKGASEENGDEKSEEKAEEKKK